MSNKQRPLNVNDLIALLEQGVRLVPAAYMDERGNVRTAATIERYPTIAESFTEPLYKIEGSNG